jgi:hypothetical protein
MPIPTSGKRREATLQERVEVAHKRAEGKPWAQTARETAVSATQAARIYRELRETKKLHDAQPSGRPKKTSLSDLWYTKRLALKNPTATIENLAERSNFSAKPDPLARTLRNEQWYARRMRRKTYLNATKKTKRYRRCLQHERCEREKWRKVVFCDETVLNSSRGGKPRLARRPPGTVISYDIHFLEAKFVSGRFFLSRFLQLLHIEPIPLSFLSENSLLKSENPRKISLG